MARKIAVEIVGDSRSLTRAFATSTTAAKRWNREIGAATRGAAAGSGLFRGLGRSLAFASGGFLAFASVTQFLTDSVDAAREAATAQRSLAAQMKTSGESFKAHRQQIEEVTVSYAKFGFQNDEVIKSLTVLERGTGKISKAIQLQGLTADLARAKNIGLADAASVVAKVFSGQETALRRAVPGLQKSAHGYDLIREAQQKLKGQAAANTTTAERFAATLHDTEEIIGTALLPTLNHYLDSATKWLSSSKHQAEIQANVTTAVNDTVAALNLLIGAFKIAKNAAQDYEDVAKKLGKAPGPLGTVFKVLLQPGFGLKELEKALGTTPKKKVKAPAGALGPITEADVKAIGTQQLQQRTGPTAKLINQWFDARVTRMLDRVQDAPIRSQLSKLKVIAGLISKRVAATKDITRRLQLEDQLVGVLRQEKAVKEQIVQGMIDALQFNVEKAGATKTLTDDLAALRKLASFLRQRLKVSKGNLDLERQLFETQQQISDVVKQQAEQRRAAQQARQFRALGFGPTGEDLVPGVKNLKKQLASVNDAISGSFLDTKKTRSLLRHIRQVLAGGLGAVGSEVRQKIKEILDDLRNQLKKNQVDVTRFHKADPLTLLGGLGLTPAQRKALRVRLSTLGPGGTVPSRSNQFVGVTPGVVVNGDVHVHGVQNIRQLEQQLTKRSKQRQHARRGAR